MANFFIVWEKDILKHNSAYRYHRWILESLRTSSPARERSPVLSGRILVPEAIGQPSPLCP